MRCVHGTKGLEVTGWLTYGANNVPILECEQRQLTGGSVLESTLGSVSDPTTLAWLKDALGCVYAHGQTNALAYLEAVMDDAVFEMDMAERRAHFIG